jgi:hypothetical protein
MTAVPPVTSRATEPDQAPIHNQYLYVQDVRERAAQPAYTDWYDARTTSWTQRDHADSTSFQHFLSEQDVQNRSVQSNRVRGLHDSGGNSVLQHGRLDISTLLQQQLLLHTNRLHLIAAKGSLVSPQKLDLVRYRTQQPCAHNCPNHDTNAAPRDAPRRLEHGPPRSRRRAATKHRHHQVLRPRQPAAQERAT